MHGNILQCYPTMLPCQVMLASDVVHLVLLVLHAAVKLNAVKQARTSSFRIESGHSEMYKGDSEMYTRDSENSD